MNNFLLMCRFSTFILLSFLGLNPYAQCTFTGLAPTYCLSDDPVTLVGDPAGGVFSGPGMALAVFTPADAGVGTHTIQYELSEATDVFYMRSDVGEPWGNTSNPDDLDAAFGAGGWTLSTYETADPAVVFAATTGFVFLDGSDDNADELNAFLVANIVTIENFVFNGGNVLINAAPNEGGNIPVGFDGTVINYPQFSNDVNIVDPMHPAAVGPLVPISTAMSGTYYGHSSITGPAGLSSLLTDVPDPTKVVLAEMTWGSGIVMFGGMTTSNYHSPSPNASNYRSNLFTYLGTGISCTYTQEVTVYDAPTVTFTTDEDEICDGESVTFMVDADAPYTFDPAGITAGVPYTPTDLGETTYTVTATNVAGCENTATVSVSVNEVPTVTASADDSDVCLGEPFTLTGAGAETYAWDGGITDGVPYTSPTAGTMVYNVTGTSMDGCTNTASITVEVADLPVLSLTVDETAICEEESVTFTAESTDPITFDPLGVVSGTPYTPTSLGETTYTATATNAAGCESTASVAVTVNEKPTVTATSNDDDNEICLGSSFILTGGGAATYTWDGGITNGVAYTPTSPGSTVYTVIGTSAEGCTDVAAISMNVVDCAPVVAGFEFDNNICLNDCITLTDTSVGSTIVSWEWDFGGAVSPTTSSLQSPTICFDSVGVFDISLTITSLYGQVSTVTNSITVNVIPTITAEHDTIIELSQEAVLTAIPSTSGSFEWIPDDFVECPTCATTTASPIDSTMYTVHFVDDNGCKAQSQVLVLVNFREGVGVPTAFSPNGDGMNDILYVKGIGLASVNLMVYNRYGELVFETNDQEVGWDGTYNNRAESNGVFTWVLQYAFVNGKRGIQKGNTTLIR